MVNDTTILTGLLTAFIILGISLPFINAGFDNPSITTTDVEGFANSLSAEASKENNLSIWRVLFSVGSIFFWSFGELPLLANYFLIIPRILLIIMVARFIWIGGGN